jgi:hypothetical protein
VSPGPRAPHPPETLRPLLFELAAIVEDALRDDPASTYLLEAALHRLALAAGAQRELHDRLAAAAARHREAVDLARARPLEAWLDETYRRDTLARHLAALATKITLERPAYSDCRRPPDSVGILIITSRIGEAASSRA